MRWNKNSVYNPTLAWSNRSIYLILRNIHDDALWRCFDNKKSLEILISSFKITEVYMMIRPPIYSDLIIFCSFPMVPCLLLIGWEIAPLFNNSCVTIFLYYISKNSATSYKFLCSTTHFKVVSVNILLILNNHIIFEKNVFVHYSNISKRLVYRFPNDICQRSTLL